MCRHITLIIVFAPLIGCYNVDISNPIIYISPEKNRLIYFGMTVLTRPNASTYSDSWVFQVGAPRGNVSTLKVKEPGAVFRCGLYFCREFILDDAGNVPGANYYYRYKDRKDEGWVGVSMDMKYSNNTLKTIICGHRWSNQNLTNDDRVALTYLMTGVCYLQDVSYLLPGNPVHKLLPLVNSDKIYYPKPHDSNKSFYYWGLGQSGTSSVMLNDLSAVIMGAPGYHNWLGTVIQYSTKSKSWHDFRVGLFENTKEFKTNSYSYIGYQVSFGRFFADGRLWLLAGAPRAGNYHGKVLVFQFKESTSQVYIASELRGSTFGEYFGSVLAVLDLNNDGFDDLVVGAPLFFHKHPEEGRIYAYLGNNRGNFLFRSQVINGRHPYSRFGSCIASLGDLHLDGYGDIAVGAPYENDGLGSVYIYRGSKKGLEMEYSQRIMGKDIDHRLRGFGISISGTVDIDGNGFNDLVIGSYLSDQVVLLRSRPIVYLFPAIHLKDTALLDRKADSFNISVCVKYTGVNVPKTIVVNILVDADHGESRGLLRGSSESLHRYETSLMPDTVTCEDLLIDLHVCMEESKKCNFEPLRPWVKVELPPCTETSVTVVSGYETKGDDKFNKVCPIGRKREAYAEVPFAGECGADNVCEAELLLNCEIPDYKKSTYLIVTSEYITLSLELINFGEPAYNTEIIIESNIDLTTTENADGRTETKRLFLIDVGSSFMNTFRANFSFRISTDSSNLTESLPLSLNGLFPTHLKLRVEAKTKSVEDFLLNNVCNIALSLLTDSTVDLYASSTATSAFYLKNTTELNFTLYYEVQKQGETPVTDAELNIYIPNYIDLGSTEAEFTSVTVETSEGIYSATSDERHKKGEGPSEVDIIWNNLNSSNASLPVSRTVYLNCSTSGIQCRTVSVVFPEGINSKISKHIKIFITLKLVALASLLHEKDVIHFTSGGILEYRKLFEVDPVLTFSHSSVTFYKEEEPKNVEPYVIALSVIAGGLLLLLIVSALVKSNFFRRKKKEELEALKSEELKRQSALEFPPEIIGDNNVDDTE